MIGQFIGQFTNYWTDKPCKINEKQTEGNGL